jgi:hypothetical protein
MGPSRDKKLGRPRTSEPQEESGRPCILFFREMGNQSKAYGEFRDETRQSSRMRQTPSLQHCTYGLRQKMYLRQKPQMSLKPRGRGRRRSGTWLSLRFFK